MLQIDIYDDQPREWELFIHTKKNTFLSNSYIQIKYELRIKRQYEIDTWPLTW